MMDVENIIANCRVHPGQHTMAQLVARASIFVVDKTFPTGALARWPVQIVAERFYPTLLTRRD